MLDYTKEPRGVPADPEQLATAWAYYKRHEDPPGVWVTWAADDEHSPDGPGEWQFGTSTADGPSMVESFGERDRDEGHQYARAAAWAWYDRRPILDGPV